MILRILLIGSESEMSWIYAATVMAAVVNLHPVRDWTYQKFVSKPMRQDFLAINTMHYSIASSSASCPVPTILCLLDFGPESLFWTSFVANN